MKELCNDKLMTRLDRIENTLEVNQQLIRILVRQHHGDKVERLSSEVQIKGRMTVTTVMNFFNISRPAALELMRKLSKHPGYKFRCGDKKTCTPSYIAYSESLALQTQFNVIDNIAQVNKQFRIADIVRAFKYFGDIQEARRVVELWIENRRGWQLNGFTISKIE